MIKKKITSLIMALLPTLLTVTFGQVITGVNNDPWEKGICMKPYEMNGRKEAREPILTFDDCTKWQVRVQKGEAGLYRTREQRIITDFSGKVAYTEPIPGKRNSGLSWQSR